MTKQQMINEIMNSMSIMNDNQEEMDKIHEENAKALKEMGQVLDALLAQ